MATFFPVNRNHLQAWLAKNEAYVSAVHVENLMTADSPVHYAKNVP